MNIFDHERSFTHSIVNIILYLITEFYMNYIIMDTSITDRYDNNMTFYVIAINFRTQFVLRCILCYLLSMKSVVLKFNELL